MLPLNVPAAPDALVVPVGTLSVAVRFVVSGSVTLLSSFLQPYDSATTAVMAAAKSVFFMR